MHCNICGGTEFEAYRGRPNERCRQCGSKARHRIALEVYEKLLFPLAGEGAKLLHLAPEKFLHPVLKERFGAGYVPADASPERYPHANAVKLFLPQGFSMFAADEFDAIIHNHVLEHIPGHYKDHLAGFVNWLKPGGLMILSVPVHTWNGRRKRVAKIFRVMPSGWKSSFRKIISNVSALILSKRFETGLEAGCCQTASAMISVRNCPFAPERHHFSFGSGMRSRT
ncbi:MAG: methyltransferase domain-containing protein [Nitratireductor sp.]